MRGIVATEQVEHGPVIAATDKADAWIIENVIDVGDLPGRWTTILPAKLTPLVLMTSYRAD